MAHPLFAPEVREMLRDGDLAGLAALCESLHPATVAEVLDDDFDAEQIWHVLESTSISNQATIFEYLPLERQIELVEKGRPQMARLIEEMSSDDRAELLREVDPKVRENLLRLVDEADRRDIARLVEYPEGSAGSHMTTDYAWLPSTVRVDEAMDRLRLQAPDAETIYVVYVVDENRRLQGVVSLRELILAPRMAPVASVMSREVVRFRATDDIETVAQELKQYDLLAVPIVDAEDRLVGIITHDDVLDVFVEEATEDAHLMGGVSPLEEGYLESSLVALWRKRAFWLSCLFVGEMLTFTAMAFFEHELAKIVVLALFVPLCISVGGNSGSQAATLVTRAMALGEVKVGDWFRVLRQELVMGLVLGLTLGLIAFGQGAWTSRELRASSPPRHEPFVVSSEKPLAPTDGLVELPAGAAQIIRSDQPVTIKLPAGVTQLASEEDPARAGSRLYQFPADCQIPRKPVDAWLLGVVIALAVAGICLWGTLIGALLPLAFKQLGADPAVASSPFVATFVDVTGIVIYFTFAKLFLFEYL